MNQDRIESGQPGEPAFSLPVENELLMLKLKAEFGAECRSGSAAIPPAVVNEFLHTVYAFEQRFSQPVSSISIYRRIGQPEFFSAAQLSDEALRRELKRIISILERHRIQLDVLGQYPARLIYSFITEEFFLQEIDDIDLPRFIHHFCYEEFHPNHEMDIRERCVEFITQWFRQTINEYSWQLGDPFIHPDTRMFSRKSILARLQNVFDAYTSFANGQYEIRSVRVEWDEQKQSGKGFAEGWVQYDAIAESGDTVRMEGPFSFYLSNNQSWWSIFYFVFPGFSWG